VGPRAGFDRCGIYRPTPRLDPRAVQPVASRYTHCAVTAHKIHSPALQGVSSTPAGMPLQHRPNAHCAGSGGPFLHQRGVFLMPSEHSV